MKMTEIKSPADMEICYDRFGRRCPYIISLINGEHLTGLYAGSSSNSSGIELIWFKRIDMELWINDADYIGSGMVYLKPMEIDEIQLCP